MPSPRLVRLCCVAGLCLVFLANREPARGEDGKNKSPQPVDFERLAEVFSPPGTPDVKDKPWVKISVGPAKHESERIGWLVKKGEKEITLLDREGDVYQLRMPMPDEKRPEIKKDEKGQFSLADIWNADRSVAWQIEPQDFSVACKKLLDDGPPKDQENEARFGFVDGRSQLAVQAARYAHFASQTGRKELAAELYNHARKAHTTYSDQYVRDDERIAELHRFVGGQLATQLRNNAIYAGHGSLSRKELQKRWETIAAIPHHQYRDEAKEMAKHYQSLIDEDARWVEPTPAMLAKMTVDQRVAYWLYRLRDLDIGQWSNPGRCYVLSEAFMTDDQAKKINAAIELKKLGFAAVPQLIAHLDDARPTRCKGHWRIYSPDGQHLLRYGDCCQQIFESITGRTIFEGGHYPIQGGKGKESRENAEKWWREFQSKGEKQMLVEGVARGDRDSAELAEKLVGKYSEAALMPIIQGAKASKKAWTRSRLVLAADQLKDEKVTAFLQEEVSGPYLESRVKAAAALVAREDSTGLKSLVREWKQIPDKDIDWREDRWAIIGLANALIQSGDPATIRLLGEEMSFLEGLVRSFVVNQLRVVEDDLRKNPLTKEATEAIEDVLVKIMSDQERVHSYSSRANGKSVNEPMIGDLAAEALAQRLNQPKLFDITGPMQIRERQHLEIKNIWLKKRGKEPVPVPAPRRITPAPEARLEPLLKAMLAAKTPAEQKQASSALAEIGLPALPAVRKLLASLKPDHPAHAEVKSLAVRLSLIVAEVRFASDSAKPNEATRARVEAFQGKTLTEGTVMDLLKETARSLPEGSRGLKITLERIPDDSGVLLVVTLIADRIPRKGLSPQLSHGSRVIVGDKRLGGGISVSAGFGGRNLTLAEIDWSEFNKNLRKGLEALPDQYLLIQADCSESR
ncbi:hypothetical protein [Zavarzinella formosa]|uniref:hypothetical protein n=1 Tax=Zavarzinella formosa TaxID=360055 RepID=UPI0003674F6E|nr:hypothetical protein [Zavarzinella formosa]